MVVTRSLILPIRRRWLITTTFLAPAPTHNAIHLPTATAATVTISAATDGGFVPATYIRTFIVIPAVHLPRPDWRPNKEMEA